MQRVELRVICYICWFCVGVSHDAPPAQDGLAPSQSARLSTSDIYGSFKFLELTEPLKRQRQHCSSSSGEIQTD